MTAERMPFSSSTRRPSMVVPAGEQTASFSAAGCWPVSSTIRAEPATAAAAMRYADALGNPSATPASAMASMNIYTYAGEQPATAVAASKRCSESTSPSPNDWTKAMTRALSASLSPSPYATDVIPQPMAAGVLGINRTIFFAPVFSASHESVLPGAMETTIASLESEGATSAITDSYI